MSRIVRESATPVVSPSDARLAVSRDPHLQAYIEALPIAAAVASMERQTSRVFVGNQAFWNVLRNAASPDDLRGLREAVDRFAAGNAPSEQFNWREPGLGGRHFQVHLAPIASRLDPGPLTLLTMIDCTTAIETERSLRSEMLLDSLTGLPNRVAFEEAVEGAAAEDGDPALAVLIVNLKRFSRVNESIGSLAGDELIITVARRMVGAMREGDLLARLGADEFGVLVRLIEGPGDTLHVARRLQSTIGTPIRLAQIELRIECAIGCALWHESLASSDELIRHGQVALKQAKKSGRIEIYQPGELAHARRGLRMETELRQAIDNGEIRFDFQPLVELRSGRVAGFEALARWSHPERGAIQPADFIPVAEESGLILPLGQLAIDTALRTLADWDRQAGSTLPVYISVNVSPVQLARESVATVVSDALARHGIDGSRLTLEVTESSIIADPDRAARLLGELKAHSCRIAMDDFGTGYSSLASLQKLPIDVLKIDRQFVAAMHDDRDSTAIVRAILAMASALGMKTIAEGIEDQSAANLLDVLGCDIGQGFWFARAIQADAAFAFLQQHGFKRAA
ncbi:diguanylate cyclase (GGDEF)-like protein [Sphingomonas vulcanisoli]|uniref:Diguanylate cyclase (GGDEF)-like protein n=1 Tax=Sphingomonas vulcanisoli TaxID=1658060 RepID=A0ABX0TSN1_9SPHN|nr:bifunctional diguanylate cyclase/phosphodiesterase [Sphingomonas vulcanisoli]NIJ08088.1 diguanylate cyclase (GGDEF)-like protein [Sphingomonas vulcanisoli]